MTSSRRKASGVYYTPAPVARYIVERTLGPMHEGGLPRKPPQILDPSCGDGNFLVEVFRYLLDRSECDAPPALQGQLESEETSLPKRTVRKRIRLAQRQLFGVDVDQDAIESAKRRLACLALGVDETALLNARTVRTIESLAQELDANLRCGDALVGPEFDATDIDDARDRTWQDHSQAQRTPAGRPDSLATPPSIEEITSKFSWGCDFAHILDRGGFDAIVGNPPYINIRVLTRTRGESINQYFRRRYRCAYRGYDVFVLFLEKAFELLRAGGVCGMIVPNKIATLDYAGPCRSLLLEHTTLRQVTDMSDTNVFPDAGVYPYVLVWQKRLAELGHQIAISEGRFSGETCLSIPTAPVRQTDWSAETGFQLHGKLAVESRVRTEPLASRAKLHSGTTGFAAHRVADVLRECDNADSPHFEFIVSRNIDRYVIRPGQVRYMKRTFRRPVLPAGCDDISEGKRRLYGSAKIVIAGMTRRLEAARDAGGLALGVQVYAAADLEDDPRFLLALLNSSLLSHLFRIRFQAKRLSGGYMAINKSQLAKLPIRIIDEEDDDAVKLRDEIVESVSRMEQIQTRIAQNQSKTHQAKLECDAKAIDDHIDQLVFELYGLNSAEIDDIRATAMAA